MAKKHKTPAGRMSVLPSGRRVIITYGKAFIEDLPISPDKLLMMGDGDFDRYVEALGDLS